MPLSGSLRRKRAKAADDVEVARLRALEESGLRALIEKAERANALDCEVAAAKEREDARKALTAVHAYEPPRWRPCRSASPA
jgi:hypothetical protein